MCCKLGRTNDLLYESNDSREILNGSFSLNTLRWLLLVVLRDEDVQKLRFSFGGEGGTKTPESLISAVASARVPQPTRMPAHTAQLVLDRLFLLDVDGLRRLAIALLQTAIRRRRPGVLVLLAKRVPHDGHRHGGTDRWNSAVVELGVGLRLRSTPGGCSIRCAGDVYQHQSLAMFKRKRIWKWRGARCNGDGATRVNLVAQGKRHRHRKLGEGQARQEQETRKRGSDDVSEMRARIARRGFQ